MKTKDFAALGKILLPKMPGFASKGMLIFAHPIGHVIRGIHFEGSSFDQKSIYANVFFQPLCVPCNHLHFTLGFRLRNMDGIDGWSSDEPDLIEKMSESIAIKAMPFLDDVATLRGAASAAEAMQSTNPHVLEAAAYCHVLSDDLEAALSSLDALGRSVDLTVAWQAEIAGRANLVRELVTSDPGGARKQLLEWEAQTAQNVGLGAFWSRQEQGITVTHT